MGVAHSEWKALHCNLNVKLVWVEPPVMWKFREGSSQCLRAGADDITRMAVQSLEEECVWAQTPIPPLGTLS